MPESKGTAAPKTSPQAKPERVKMTARKGGRTVKDAKTAGADKGDQDR